jgi:hypothetical protein
VRIKLEHLIDKFMSQKKNLFILLKLFEYSNNDFIDILGCYKLNRIAHLILRLLYIEVLIDRK